MARSDLRQWSPKPLFESRFYPISLSWSTDGGFLFLWKRLWPYQSQL